MGLESTISNFFDTTATVQRRTVAQDDVGDVVETWSDIITNMPITIQPLSGREQKEQKDLEQGNEFKLKLKAYVGVDNDIKNNDRIISESKTYDVVGVDKYRASKSTISAGHHLKLMLEIPRDIKS